MPFAAGTRLGPYEIIAPLGAGGMGEVYRAHDTRLDRPVAVKVLTGALAADSEARQRFEHEARAIAALNDPHICTIHDIGRHGELDYLVLEYLEGETLADRLRRSPELPVDEALAIAIQIGDALDRAHRAGIVHRDLKPGNVMLVRRSGPAFARGSGAAGPSGAPDVKLLDFGLAARTTVPRPQAVDASLSATMAPTLAATRPPATTSASGFGTVQYMAPEQLDGDAGDHRADIFAFGCVLYEMLAGRKAFEGAVAVTVIAAIMSSEPPPIAALQSAHPLLDHVLRRCLEKDRERRWQNVSDLTGELRWIVEHPIAAPVTAAPAARPSRIWQAAIALGLVLAAVAAVAGGRALGGRAAAPDLPALRLEISTAPTDDPSMALSPDGTQIAFVANQDRVPVLWVRRLDAIENRALSGTGGASFPFWSPDGRTIGFFADDKLKRIDAAGGMPALVVTDAPNARGATWNSDGVILFVSGVTGPIKRVPARGGQAESVTQVNTGSGPAHRLPQFLPDGKRFLFSSALGTADTNGIYLASLDKTPPVRLVPDDTNGYFAAPDKLLTIRQGALQAYRFNVATGVVQGEPVVIAQGFSAAAANSMFAASDAGVLAYRAGTAQRRQLVWVNRQGAVLRVVGEPESDFIASPELSADEQSVVVFLQRTGDNDIWVIELARNLAHRVTDGPPADAHPLWDPDGQHIVFSSRRFGGGGPARQAVSGGKAEPLFASGESGLPLSWTRDRQFMLLRRDSATSGSDLVAVATEGERRDVVVARSQYDETEGQFSPDGKWVAFGSNESGRPEVFVQSFPEGRGRMQVSTGGGAQIRWSGDGKEIFLRGAGREDDGGVDRVRRCVAGREAAGAPVPDAPRHRHQRSRFQAAVCGVARRTIPAQHRHRERQRADRRVGELDEEAAEVIR
jgi:Tol biopolymer transport system component/tRNA A-37 threonylcarbamoyl transferase component Bud32